MTSVSIEVKAKLTQQEALLLKGLLHQTAKNFLQVYAQSKIILRTVEE